MFCARLSGALASDFSRKEDARAREFGRRRDGMVTSAKQTITANVCLACHCSRTCRLLCLAPHAVRLPTGDRPHLVFFPILVVLRPPNTDLCRLFLNCRSVFLDPAVPSPTVGILSADNILVWDPAAALVISADLFLLLFELTFVSLLVLRQRYLNSQTSGMDNNEMAIHSSSIQFTTDGLAPPMDVDVENNGLPFPGALLADGTFAIEYHNM
jgi:hypothetical protein